MKSVAAMREECRQKLEAVQADVAALGSREATSPYVIKRAIDSFHSVKDAAALLRCYPLKQLSFLAENLLIDVRDRQLAFSTNEAGVLQAAVDCMNQMVGDSEPRVDIEFSEQLKNLKAMLAPKDAANDAAPMRRLRMLVVEDDMVPRVVLQGLLAKYGECDIAVNGREGLEAFNAARQAGQPYDLICLDVSMPELDGPGALAQIRSTEVSDPASPRSRIFMTTSVRDREIVAETLKMMCDAYLLKPIDGEKLEERLTSFGLIRRKRWLSP